ncbi:hypothetical protein B0I35DRAFT_410600 [Stachybotrys elegans]|uniref:Uncharacterized protein n=1 Tax=Stachybotrys elegans TaxID=80388 RepID=A0A8K0SL72_9HYPO|nr:hypothetical protein B0I35DRAFT_410600 [Stachybotrys elegans]
MAGSVSAQVASLKLLVIKLSARAPVVAMAVEAVRQVLASDSRAISGFTVRQGWFLSSIAVSETFEDATKTICGPSREPMRRRRHLLLLESRWAENFRVEIQAQFQEVTTTHRQMANLKWDGQTTAVVRVDMLAAKTHYQFLPQHDDAESPFHPAVLDATLHLVNCYVSRGLGEPLLTLAPQRVASLWLPAKVWDQETTSRAAVEKSLYALADEGSHWLFLIRWRPQPSALTAQELKKLCEATINIGTCSEMSPTDLIAKLERAMGAAARKVLARVYGIRVRGHHAAHRRLLRAVRPDDGVITGALGSIRSRPCAPAEAVLNVPNALSWYAAVPGVVPGMTAYHALVTVDTHSATGATGQFAIGLAKMLGVQLPPGRAQRQDRHGGHRRRLAAHMDRFVTNASFAAVDMVDIQITKKLARQLMEKVFGASATIEARANAPIRRVGRCASHNYRHAKDEGADAARLFDKSTDPVERANIVVAH